MINWSFTRMNEFINCPRKYKYKYIDKNFGMEKSDALCIGTGVHAVLEHYAVNHDLSLERARQIYMDHALTDKAASPVKVQESFEIVEAYYESGKVLTPKRDPLKGTYCTEDFFRFPLTDEINLTGKLDIITEKDNVVDYKTSSKFYYDKDVLGILEGKGLQLTMFAAAYYFKYKKMPNYVGFQVILTRPPRGYSARVQNIGAKRTVEHVEQLNEYVKQIHEQEKKYTKENFFPVGVDPMCHWCQFKAMCGRDGK